MCTIFTARSCVTPLQLGITMTRSHVPCVGTMDVWHSVFADLEDDLTVGTVVKTVVVVVSRAGQAKRVPGRPKLLVVLQISGCRMRPARGAGCRPQFAAQVAKGWAAGSFVSCAAREPPRAPTACHPGVHDRQFWVDRTDFDFCRFLAAE